MTAAFFDRVPVERITSRARATHLGRVLLTVLAGLLFAVGWVAFKVCAAVWLAVAWSAVAVREGWRQAATPTTRRTR